MIKFFRHIRQQLIRDNKMGKYFKYAIGEIILVVIGILIALQINNWNENRKLKQQEAKYYCQLVADLNADISNIKRTQKSLNERQESARRFLINLLKIQETKDTLFADYIPALRSINFVPTKGAIEDITSSGKLENFTNQEHKNAILSYYVEQDISLDIKQRNTQQLSQKIFSYDSYTDFGINLIPLYKNVYGDELQNLLKTTEWQRDPKNKLFRHVMDHMNMTIVICEREKEVLNQIKVSAEALVELIKPNCK